MGRSDAFPEVLFHKVLHALKSGFSAQTFTHELTRLKSELGAETSRAEVWLGRFALGKLPGSMVLREPAPSSEISV